jgi:hypothetical protein
MVNGNSVGRISVEIKGPLSHAVSANSEPAQIAGMQASQRRAGNTMRAADPRHAGQARLSTTRDQPDLAGPMAFYERTQAGHV